MSGGYIPYHLRPGKAIDRKLFIETLHLLSRKHSIEDYTYIGFGGPFLEDFKQIHSETFIKNMISLEEEENVKARQEKNLPFSCIDCRLQTSEDFIDTYSVEGNVAIWLDYASPKIGEQIQEFQTLLTKLQEGDVVKITLNSNIETLGSPSKLSRRELPKHRLRNLKSKINDYLDNSLQAEDLSQRKYPVILLKALMHASYLALKGKKLSYLPVVACTYQDTHKMLTVTGVVVNAEKKEEFISNNGLNYWPFLYDEENILDIKVPALSVRERLEVDAKMPSENIEQVHDDLGFLFDVDREKSLGMIRNYLKFYRQYPQYTRVII